MSILYILLWHLKLLPAHLAFRSVVLVLCSVAIYDLVETFLGFVLTVNYYDSVDVWLKLPSIWLVSVTIMLLWKTCLIAGFLSMLRVHIDGIYLKILKSPTLIFAWFSTRWSISEVSCEKPHYKIKLNVYFINVFAFWSYFLP